MGVGRSLLVQLSSPSATDDQQLQVRNPAYFKYGQSSLAGVNQIPGVSVLTVFYNNVINGSFQVQPFDVTMTIGPGVSGATWQKTSGPASGQLLGSGTTRTYRDPTAGGIYTFDVAYNGQTTRTYLGLPLAGAEVKEIVRNDLSRADIFATAINAVYSLIERNNPVYDILWFFADGNGDYLGRPDSAANPTMWPHNQVSDATGHGAVATWFGYPTRVGKMNNFIVAYGARKIGVIPIAGWLSQVLGTFPNDSAASKSWDAGWSVAGGANYDSTTAAMTQDIWDESDIKNQRLWPNLNLADNHVSRANQTDYNIQFSSPGFVDGFTP